MLWAPGAGQSPPRVSVVHPVTWAVQGTRAEGAGGSFLPGFSRAGTRLVPHRARLALLHSWDKEIRVYFPGSGGQVTPLHPSWSLTPTWAFLPLDLGFGALGTQGCASIHSPNAGAVELLCHGFILSFHSLCSFLVLMEIPKEDQCLGKSRACTWQILCGHEDGILDIRVALGLLLGALSLLWDVLEPPSGRWDPRASSSLYK